MCPNLVMRVDARVREGMTFVVTMSLADVPLADRKESRNADVAKLDKFSVLITDTVRPRAPSPPSPLADLLRGTWCPVARSLARLSDKRTLRHCVTRCAAACDPQVAVDSRGPDCLTQKAHKTFDRVSWEIADESEGGDDDDDDDDEGDERKSPVKAEPEENSNSVRLC